MRKSGNSFTAIGCDQAMSIDNTLVSVGLPVFNGARYLQQALDSLVGQTYENIELVICDNASTDGTADICHEYQARDKRIRYYLNEENVGAAENYNRCFRLARGEYFKWAAHDDVCAPELLARCVEVLERDPSVVVCFGEQVDIDERGARLKKRPYGFDTALEHPYERFCQVTRLSGSMPAIFGLMRADVLKRTPLIGKFAASDKVLLAELALYGRFHELDGILHYTRQHPLRSVRAYPTRQAMTEWFDPTRKGRIVFPITRLFVEYFRSVGRAPLDWRTRLRCRMSLLGWLAYHRRGLRGDAIAAVRQLTRTQLPSRSP